MARKVILDVDPGIDDAVALCMALFDPRLEVVAVTAACGNVSGVQATRNVQAIIEHLDPPRRPRIGWGVTDRDGPAVDTSHIFGSDGLGNSNLQVSELHHRHGSEKVICDEVRAAPGQVTIVAMGPLTNIARALMRDPELPSILGELIIMGGTVSGPGNVTPAAEFNIYCDPNAARTVFRSATTKTLIPLDITSQLIVNYDFLDELPDDSTKAGGLLRKILPFMFRSHHEHFGQEGIHLHDAVALVSLTDPELFERAQMAGDVETAGELTLGATIFDRRERRGWRPNMDVATSIDTVAAVDCMLRGLKRAAAS